MRSRIIEFEALIIAAEEALDAISSLNYYLYSTTRTLLKSLRFNLQVFLGKEGMLRKN